MGRYAHRHLARSRRDALRHARASFAQQCQWSRPTLLPEFLVMRRKQGYALYLLHTGGQEGQRFCAGPIFRKKHLLQSFLRKHGTAHSEEGFCGINKNFTLLQKLDALLESAYAWHTIYGSTLHG